MRRRRPAGTPERPRRWWGNELAGAGPVPPGHPAGVGIDLLEIRRLEEALERRPPLAQRLFTEGELAYAGARRRPARHLAARFAAKEAAVKALGAGPLPPREVEITGERARDSAPAAARSRRRSRRRKGRRAPCFAHALARARRGDRGCGVVGEPAVGSSDYLRLDQKKFHVLCVLFEYQ